MRRAPYSDLRVDHESPNSEAVTVTLQRHPQLCGSRLCSTQLPDRQLVQRSDPLPTSLHPELDGPQLCDLRPDDSQLDFSQPSYPQRLASSLLHGPQLNLPLPNRSRPATLVGVLARVLANYANTS